VARGRLPWREERGRVDGVPAVPGQQGGALRVRPHHRHPQPRFRARELPPPRETPDPAPVPSLSSRRFRCGFEFGPLARAPDSRDWASPAVASALIGTISQLGTCYRYGLMCDSWGF